MASPIETAADEHPTLAERTDRARGTGYIPTLDGWRAVAIVWVLFGHSQVWHFGRFSTSFITENGGRGVSIFFALSGFLICSRLLHEEANAGGISLRSFYVRRVFRIQPAALTYLLVLSLLGISGVFAVSWRGVAGAGLMVRNFWPITDPKPVWDTAHFWSLSVEEHFYLLLPGFLVLCRRWRLSLLLWTVMALQVWYVIVFHHKALKAWGILIYLRTDLALDIILLGSLLALALARPQIQRFAMRWVHPWVALLIALFVFNLPVFKHHTWEHVCQIVVYPLLLAATILHPRAFYSRLLELAPLRFIGRISYSLYLWQQLFLNPYEHPTPGSFRSHNLLCWGASLICALASYYLVETPFIRMGHKVTKHLRTQKATLPSPLLHSPL